MSETVPIRVTLADLIDQREATRAELARVMAHLQGTDTLICKAMTATGKQVEHNGRQWFVGVRGCLDSLRFDDRADRFPLPEARDVEVPAECLRDRAEAAGDEAIRRAT